MLSEIFGLLQSVDVTGKGSNRKLGLRVNLNRNRIRSISAFSSNSIFYFPCIVSDQSTPEEIAMVSRMVEKSYASFVVACISLMPFHRIRADDQASIEEYLNQFHQNIGMTGGSGAMASKAFNYLSNLEESASDAEARVGEYLYDCWKRSLQENTDFVKVVSSEVSLNDMFNESAVDEKTRVIQERFQHVQDELNTWGFIGDASDDMFDLDDEDYEEYEDDDDIDDDYDDDENEIDESSTNVTVSMIGEGASSNFDTIYKAAQKNLDSPLRTVALGPVNNTMQVEKVFNAVTTEAEFKKAVEFARKYYSPKTSFGKFDVVGNVVDSVDDRVTEIYIKQKRAQFEKKYKSVNEGTVKAAIDSIKFSLESVSENKILSCQSLTKLASLESKLKKLKGKYTRYLNRYKKKWKENQENGTRSKLAIRFNNIYITNPKAFMKQYGGYIKIINRRLKLVEKRRAELRKRKGIKVESAIPDLLTKVEFDAIEYCDNAISECLSAPDSEVFMILGESVEDDQRKVINSQRKTIDDLNKKVDDLKRDYEQFRAEGKAAVTAAFHKERSALSDKRDMANLLRTTTAAHKAQLDARDAQHAAEMEQLKAQMGRKGAKPKRSFDPDSRINIDYGDPAGGVNMAYVNRHEFKTFEKEVFTDMDMKKANEAIPIFTKASIGFVIDETEEVVSRTILIGIKAYIHKAPSLELINDVYNCIINKRKFLRFVKFITGEERSLSDLLFGIKELRTDALDAKSGAGQWRSAFKRRRRWAKMSIPYLTKEYTPNGTIVLTMNEVNYIKDQYGIDIMAPDHVRMIMDSDYLLGFVVIDQANEMVHVTYDGHGYGFQQYTYAMLEREAQTSDRMMRELYRAMAR